MTTFFTADTHFQHGNIIKYCSRPFASAQEMDDVMFRNWAAVVQPNDAIYHLGDVFFGDAERVLPRLRALPGKKYLIPGNHDPQKLAVLSEVFEILPALTEISIPVARKDKHVRLALCHYAMRTWNNSHQGGRIMLYGHSHGRLPGNNLSLDVGVDCWGFQPVSLQEVLQRLETLPAYQGEHGA